MNDGQVHTSGQVHRVLAGTQALEFRPTQDADRYARFESARVRSYFPRAVSRSSAAFPMKPFDSMPLALQRSEELLTAARDASAHAHAPYSRFRVGAAVLVDDGRVFTAANVENASYGLASCAERNAVFAAVSAGARSVVAVAIYTPTGRPVAPCGACRQVIHEFGADAVVVSGCNGDARRSWTIGALLPDAFGARDL